MTIKSNLKNYLHDLSNLDLIYSKMLNNNFITNDKLCLQFENNYVKK